MSKQLICIIEDFENERYEPLTITAKEFEDFIALDELDRDDFINTDRCVSSDITVYVFMVLDHYLTNNIKCDHNNATIDFNTLPAAGLALCDTNHAVGVGYTEVQALAGLANAIPHIV